MSTQTQEKIFVNSAFFNEKVFDNGDSIIKVDIKDTDEFVKFVKENKNKDNTLRLIISKKKTQQEGKSSHYSYVDTWVPNGQKSQSKSVGKSSKPAQQQQEEEELI